MSLLLLLSLLMSEAHGPMENIKGTEGFGEFKGKSLQGVIEAQRELLHSQIEELQKIVVLQCRLTGINPLSQEMAAGALSIKIGRRPRDLLTPKAIKCLQGIFAIKDTVTKREARETSALCGATITQVREFFSGQRSRVRRLARQSRDKANSMQIGNTSEDGVSTATKQSSCLTTTLQSESGAGNRTVCKESYWLPNENPLEDKESFDTNFIKHFFLLMRKEGTFSGQVQLLERILQIRDSTVLCWFITKGGIPILSKWLSQASVEEQTTVLHVIFKVLCHLPLHKALPVQMSTILQTVNKLRFYRTSDISNRARILLARWSKLFVRSQSGRKSASLSSQIHAQKGGLQGQDDCPTKKRADVSLREETDSNKRVKTNSIEEPQECMRMSAHTITSTNFPRHPRLSESSVQNLDSEGSKKRPAHSISLDYTKERRKVLLVEEPSTGMAKRKLNTGAISKTRSRPLSTDDIQKAKRQAQLLQNRNGELDISKFDNGNLEKTKPSVPDVAHSSSHGEDHNKAACSKASPQESNISDVTSQSCEDTVQAVNGSVMVNENLVKQTVNNVPIQELSLTVPKQFREIQISKENIVEETRKDAPIQEPSLTLNEQFEENQIPKKNLVEETGKNVPIQEPSLTIATQFVEIKMPWMTPPGMRIDPSWRFASGEESKEVEFQSERVKREKEAVYPNDMSIPCEPKEPWDIELDYDDSLTLEIPLQPIVTEDSPKLFSIGNDERRQLQEMGDLKIEGSDCLVGVPNGKSYIGAHHPAGIISVSSYTESNSDSLKQVTGSNGEPVPDLELLAVLLKNPDLVFALTSDQGARINKAETVALLDLLKATSSKQESFGGVSSLEKHNQNVISSSECYKETLVNDTKPSASILQSIKGLAEQISTAAVVSPEHMLQSDHQASTNSFYKGGHGDSTENGDSSSLGLMKKQKFSPPSHDFVPLPFVFPQDTEETLAQEPREQLYRTENSWSKQETAKPSTGVPLVRPMSTSNKDLWPEYVRSSNTSQPPTWPLVIGQNQLKDGFRKKHGFGISIPHAVIMERDSLKTINKVPSGASPVIQPPLKHSPLNGANSSLPVTIPAGKPSKQSVSQALLSSGQSFVRQSHMHEGHIRAPNGPVIPAPSAIESVQASSNNNAGFTQGSISERGDHIDRIRSLVMDFGRDTGRDHTKNNFLAHGQGHGLRPDILPPPSNYPNIFPRVQPNLLRPEPVEWVRPRRAPSNYSQRPMPKVKIISPRNPGAPNVRGDHSSPVFHHAHNRTNRMFESGHSNQPGNFRPQSPWAWKGRGAPPRAGRR